MADVHTLADALQDEVMNAIRIYGNMRAAAQFVAEVELHKLISLAVRALAENQAVECLIYHQQLQELPRVKSIGGD